MSFVVIVKSCIIGSRILFSNILYKLLHCWYSVAERTMSAAGRLSKETGPHEKSLKSDVIIRG